MKIPNGFNLDAYLHELELTYIDVALKTAKGNKTEAANMLGLNRTTLVERLRSYGYKLNAYSRDAARSKMS